MKIVTWNSNGYFSERFPTILEEDADIYVIQECENPLIIDSEEYKEFASNYYWVSENPRYGLGIFAKDKVKLELIDLDDKGLRYFIPVRVNDDFNLLGVWTNPDMEGSKVIHYPKEITKYYEEHKDSGFFNEDMIICGDFNCDVRLVDKRHGKNVYEVIEKLSEKGLVDTYHYLTGEEQGKESIPTFYWRRNLNSPFHLDHVFSAPEKVKDLQIGGVLNVSAQMLDSNLISVHDMLQDVGILIGRSIEQAAINMILNNNKVATYNYTAGDDSGVTILKAQEKFKESAGSFCNLNSMAVNYKSLTTLKSDMFANNRQVEPVEAIKSYYGVDNIDLLGTAVCDGGSEIAEKTYIGMDYQNPGMKLLYSRISGTTVAPLGPDGDVYDFYPLIEFMRKDIRDELPMYTKLFILTSVGVLMNAPNRIIKGKFRA